MIPYIEVKFGVQIPITLTRLPELHRGRKPDNLEGRRGG